MISIIPKDSDAVIEQKRRFAEQVDRDNAHLPIYLITAEDYDFDKCFFFVRCDRTVIDAIRNSPGPIVELDNYVQVLRRGYNQPTAKDWKFMSERYEVTKLP